MIGVFDSGVGGFSALKKLMELCPKYDYIYLADGMRSPYGGKNPSVVLEYTKKGVDFLFQQGATLVILACNTASVVALREIQAMYGNDKKVLGVVIPTAEAALKSSRYGTIGVVGTHNTITSNAFETELKRLEPTYYNPKDIKAKKNIQVFSQSCPLLVPLIEENWEQKPETTMILKKYLRYLKSCNIDTLILGCTHYPLIKEKFQRIMGKNCTMIDSGSEQAKSLQEYLLRHPEIEANIGKNQTRTFYTTDRPDVFVLKAKKFLGMPIKALPAEL